MATVSHRLPPLLAAAAVTFAVALLLPDLALAAGENPVKQGLDGLGALFSIPFAVLATVTTGLVVILTTYMAVFAGEMMSSAYILDSGMGEVLHLVWTTIRNFVNVGFIVVLLIIAILVILGIGEGGGTGVLKKSLKTFVIGLVMVNFTFFGCRFILTIADVLATVVFTIPSAVPVVARDLALPCGPTGTTEECQKKLRNDGLAIVTSASEAKDGGDLAKKVQDTVQGFVTGGVTSGASEAIRSRFGKENALFSIMLYMYGLTKPLTVNVANLNGSGDLFVNAVFSFVTSLATGLIVVAIFVAMIVRVAILWLTIAIMPVVALGYVLKEVLPFEAGGKIDFDPWKEFLTHAFLPVFVAVPLTLGFILMLAGSSITGGGATGTVSLLAGTNAVNDILWWLIGVVAIWTGTFKALKASEYVSQFTDGIQGFGNTVMSGVGEMAKYAPVLPTGKKNPDGTDKKTSLGGLGDLLNAPLRGIEMSRRAEQEGATAAAEDWAKTINPNIKLPPRATAELRANQRIDEALTTIATNNTRVTSTSQLAPEDVAVLKGILKNKHGLTPDQLKELDGKSFDELVQVVKQLTQGKQNVDQRTLDAARTTAASRVSGEAAAAMDLTPTRGGTFAGETDLYRTATTAGVLAAKTGETALYENKDHAGDTTQTYVVDVKGGNKVLGTVDEVAKEVKKVVDSAERSTENDKETEAYAATLLKLTAQFRSLSEAERKAKLRDLFAGVSVPQQSILKSALNGDDEWNAWLGQINPTPPPGHP